MKQVIYMSVFSLIGLLIVISLFFLWGRQSRKNDLDNAVNTAMEQTMQCVLKGKGEIANEEEMRDFFEKRLLKQINKGSEDACDENQEISIEYYESNPIKGILSCKVTQAFSYPDGRVGKVEVKRTALRERRRNMRFVEVVVLGEKKFIMEAGTKFDLSKHMKVDGKEVHKWRDMDGRIYEFPMKVMEDMVIEPVL